MQAKVLTIMLNGSKLKVSWVNVNMKEVNLMNQNLISHLNNKNLNNFQNLKNKLKSK